MCGREKSGSNPLKAQALFPVSHGNNKRAFKLFLQSCDDSVSVQPMHMDAYCVHSWFIFHNWKCFLSIDSLYFISPLLGSQQSQEQPSGREGSSSDMHNENEVSLYHILIKMWAFFSNLRIVVIPNASWGVEFLMLIFSFAFLLTVMQNSSCNFLAEFDTLQYRSVSITSCYSVLLS